MVISALAVFLFVSGAAEVSEVGVQRTPGKPMQFFEDHRPAEEIVARKDGEKLVLCVRVNVPREGVKKYSEETAALTPKEWESILEIVGREKLLDWKPDPKGERVFDWGSSGLRVKSEKENAHIWTEPLKNGEGPAALSKRLSSLAAEKVKSLKLYYLAP